MQSIPTIIQSEIQRFNDRRCLTIYGIPEDSTMTEKVNSIFNLVSISPLSISILHRLGKPRQDKSPRPLKISIKEDVPFPRLIDLADAMKRDCSLSTFHVRKFETPEQRRAGFLARQAKRDATAAVPTTLQTTPAPAETKESVAETTSPVKVPTEESSDDESLASEDIVEFDDFHDKMVKRLRQIWDNGGYVPDLYALFRKLHYKDQKFVSDRYFELYNFRLHQ